MNKTQKQMADFAVNFVASIDNINKHESEASTIQACIALLLQGLGYSLKDSYGASTALDISMQAGGLGGVSGAYNLDNYAATLMSMVMTAAEIIERGAIPDFIKEQVERTLSK